MLLYVSTTTRCSYNTTGNIIVRCPYNFMAGKLAMFGFAMSLVLFNSLKFCLGNLSSQSLLRSKRSLHCDARS